MAQNLPNMQSAKVVTGLDTYTHTIVTAGMHTVTVQLTEVPPSGATITIQLNGSTIGSAAAPSAAQSSVTLNARTNCAVSDVISIILASSSSIDQQKNTIKATINIRAGIM